MNSLYRSKVKYQNAVTPRIWCPCKGACMAGCVGTCRWQTGLG